MQNWSNGEMKKCRTGDMRNEEMQNWSNGEMKKTELE